MNNADEHATISSEASATFDKPSPAYQKVSSKTIESKKAGTISESMTKLTTKSLKPSLKSTAPIKAKPKELPQLLQQQQSPPMSLSVFSSEGSESSQCSFVSPINKFERIKLNVGGEKYETTLFTLQQYPGN
jgi:hypothetical protein